MWMVDKTKVVEHVFSVFIEHHINNSECVNAESFQSKPVLRNMDHNNGK